MRNQLIEILFILASCSTVALSCSCIYPPPNDQDIFCGAQHVFLAYVEDEAVIDPVQDFFSMKKYPLFVFHISRDEDNQLAPFFARTMNVSTASNGAACGLDLAPFTSYLLTSNTVNDRTTGSYQSVGLCGWNVPATSLSASQIVGLLSWEC